MSSRVKCLAIAAERPILAAAEFESTVSIWSVGNLRSTAEFKTIMDAGGRRLAVSNDGESLFAGSFVREELACYSSRCGEVLWLTKGLGKVQRIALSSDGRFAYCGTEAFTCHVITTQSGKVIDTIHAVESMCDSPYQSVKLLDGKELVLDCVGLGRRTVIPRETFAVLTRAFGPSSMCFSESGGATRCISTMDGCEIWRYVPPEGQHLLELA